MTVHFLVEDPSGEKFLKAFMEKYNAEDPANIISYDIKPYRGIGGFPKGPNAKNNKSQQLLSDLPKRLKALNVKLKYEPHASVFVVLDNDTRDTAQFKADLQMVLLANDITIDNVFCIAIEEMEAWLLGDQAALCAAFPSVADRISSKLPNYQQDSICGTWETLADIITKGGIGKFKKKNPTPQDVGCRKSEWAEAVGAHLNIRENASPSFQEMLRALDERRAVAFPKP